MQILLQGDRKMLGKCLGLARRAVAVRTTRPRFVSAPRDIEMIPGNHERANLYQLPS